MWNYVFDISHIIDTVSVIEKVKDLFKGHPSLLLCLNPFLPNGYEILLNDEDEKTYFMEQALRFPKKLKVTIMLPYDFNNKRPTFLFIKKLYSKLIAS